MSKLEYEQSLRLLKWDEEFIICALEGYDAAYEELKKESKDYITLINAPAESNPVVWTATTYTELKKEIESLKKEREFLIEALELAYKKLCELHGSDWPSDLIISIKSTLAKISECKE